MWLTWSLLLCGCWLSGTSGLLVDTKYGQILGHAVPLDDGTIINSFYSIPFAKPPVGDLRFRAPQEPDPWDNVFEALPLPSACPQQRAGLIWMTHPGWDDYEEDCLTLNVFAPNDTSGAPYPVMVWFHGGGYLGSASVQYPGHFLAAKGTVVVVTNYRLGALGFMSTDDDVSTGNYGMLDQVLSLEFVRDNILQFGGDPGKVTIFGQSAGASSSGLHMLSEKSRGLFHQAILESGSELAAWAVNAPGQDPHEYTKASAARLNCTTDDNTAMMECLRAVDSETLRENQWVSCKPGWFCQGFAPVVDGEGGFLTDTPWNLRRNGQFQNVPMIIGHTTDDGSPYTIGLIPEAEGGGFNRTMFLDLLRNRLVGIFAPQFPEKEEDVYEAMKFFYSAWPYLDDELLNRELFNIIITDFGFGVMSDLTTKYHAERNDVYFYLLGLLSANSAEFVPAWMGVPHNGELPYVWGWPKLKGNFQVRVDCGIFFDIVDWTEQDRRWADYVQDMWVNFAKTGNPTPDPLDTPDFNPPTEWQKYTVPNDLQYLYIDYQVENRVNYRQDHHAFWTKYLSYISGIEIMGEGAKTVKTDKPGLDTGKYWNNINDFYARAVKRRIDGMH